MNKVLYIEREKIMSYYHAEVVNLSLKNVDIINNYKTIDIKKRVWGFVKIYTLLIPSEKIDEAVNYFQSNMSTRLKKEWYITFHNENEVIVVFRSKIFKLSPKGILPVHGKLIDISSAEQKNEWNKMINYAKSLGIPDSQCDFLPEELSVK